MRLSEPIPGEDYMTGGICFIFNTFCWVFIFAGKEVYGVAEKVVENQDIIEIGNNIQKIRKKNGISQSVLAEKIDVAGKGHST